MNGRGNPGAQGELPGPRSSHRRRDRLAAGLAAALGGGGIVLLALTLVQPLPPAPPTSPLPSARVEWQGVMPAGVFRFLAPAFPGAGVEPPAVRPSLRDLHDLSLARDIGEAPPRLLLEEHGSWDQWFLLRREETTERPLILENTEENLRLFGRQPGEPVPGLPARVLLEWTDLTTGEAGQSALPASEALLAARRESSNLSPAIFLLQKGSGGLVPEPLRTASSGSPEVDRLLGDLLRTEDLGLPADTHYLRLTVHLPPAAPDD